MVLPGCTQGRWPSPVPRWLSAKIITRIAFWLPSGCGMAPTPTNAPGLRSASVALATPNTATLSVRFTFSSPSLVFTTIAGPSMPEMVPMTRWVCACCASAGDAAKATASAAPARIPDALCHLSSLSVAAHYWMARQAYIGGAPPRGRH